MADSDYSTSSLAAKAAQLQSAEDSQMEQNKISEKEEVANTNKGDRNRVPEVPDYPSCDYCGEEFAGKLFCSQCRCAYYCSKECQKKHWKAPNGHKANCLKMEEICKTKAESFISLCDEYCTSVFHKNLSEMCPLPAPHVETIMTFQNLMENGLLKGLDENGPYKKALDLGLNEKLLQLFKCDLTDVKYRFELGIPVSIVQCVQCTLFRGKRNIPGNIFSCIDGYRVKQYLRSNDTAFETWFRASLKVIELFQTLGAQAVRNNEMDKFWQIQKAAKDIANGWTFVFANKKAAKAILLGSSKEADEKAVEQAKWIIAQMKDVINNFSSRDTPDEINVESQTLIFTAMIELRMKEFGIDIGDITQLFELDTSKKEIYECMAITLGKGFIKKGGDLDSNEMRQIRENFFSKGRKTTVGTKSARGGKKGRKRGKNRKK